MEQTAQLFLLVVRHLVVQTLFARKTLEPLCVCVMLVTKVMDTTAQIPVSAIIPRVTVVTPTPCVPTLKDRTSVDVPEGTKEMVGSAQTLMNALILMKMTVTSTPCVRTLKDLMFVVVKRDILEMVETAQLLYPVVPQLVVQTLSARKTLEPLRAFVK